MQKCTVYQVVSSQPGDHLPLGNRTCLIVSYRLSISQVYSELFEPDSTDLLQTLCNYIHYSHRQELRILAGVLFYPGDDITMSCGRPEGLLDIDVKVVQHPPHSSRPSLARSAPLARRRSAGRL